MKRAVLGVVLAASAVATAAPVASIRADLDGNGTPDRIELGADGTLVVGAGISIKLAPSATSARLAVVKTTGPAQILVDLTRGTTREGIVIDRGKVIARFPLGAVGLDGEYSREAEATASGIVRYQSRVDVRRCDDQPAYLFAERLEGATWKKLDKLPTLVAAAAPTLAAKLDVSGAAPPLIFQARAVSHQAGAHDAGGLAIPRELDDGRPDTAWREETASQGEGQFFTFRARIAARPEQLRIVPGLPTTSAAMRTAARPHVMAIVTREGAWRFELPDAANDPLGAAYVVDLPPAITGDCITVVLESAYGHGATTIAELGVYADGERRGGAETLLAKVVAEGKPGATNAAAALAHRGAAAARAIDAELATTTDAGARRRLVGALARIRDPAAAASLVRAATEGWVRDRDLVDVIAALASAGRHDTLRDLAAKRDLPVEVRIAAVTRLPTAGTGFDLLVELAGHGPRALRRQIIERLATAPIDGLVTAAEGVGDPPRAGDVWRAATRAARRDPARRPGVVAAMQRALASVTDYERRYRLVDGIATHGDAAAITKLIATLGALPPGTETSALRQVAIRGVASAPRSAAVGLVIGAATDADPGVRLAAIAAIANTETDAAGVWHGPDGPGAIDRLIANAMADTWPEVRRRAARALGGRCARTQPARALFQALGLDRDLDVRIDALTALVQCQAAGVRELLPRTWDSPKQPLRVREHAIGQVVALGDQALAATLCNRFARWRGQAIESREALTLAQRAAATLGTLAPACAAQALLDGLEDSAFPEIVSASALGLGELGPACPAAAKTKLQALARSDEPSAIAAKRGAARCGRGSSGR